MNHKLISALLFSVVFTGVSLPSWANGGHDSHHPGQPAVLSLVASFNPALGQLPESVTVDAAGNFYLSMANTVQKLTPDGQLALFAQLPIPSGAFATGVKFGPDGDLYAGSGGFDPAQDAANVFRISASGAVTTLAHLNPNTFPNDLAFDAAGNVYVTEPFLGKIVKITPQGVASDWADGPLLAGDPLNPALIVHNFGADGIAFDKGKRNLYVGNLDAGSIVRIPLKANGSAGTPKLWVADPRLKACDGIAFDKEGNLYVAVNGQNQLLKINKHRAISTIATGAPLDAPSSLVFGAKGENMTNLYISSFAINRALGTQPGTPQPNLLKLPVKVPGLSIP